MRGRFTNSVYLLAAFIAAAACVAGCGANLGVTSATSGRSPKPQKPAGAETIGQAPRSKPLTATTLPPGVVADVGGTEVSLAALEHKTQVAAGLDFYSAAKVRAPSWVFADSHNASRCAAFLAGLQARHAMPKMGAAAKKTVCARLGLAMEQQALAGIIEFDWLIGQAKELGVELSKQERESAFARWRAEQFPHSGEFQKYLSDRNMTVADAREGVEEEVLSHKLVRQLEELQGKGAYGRFERRATPEWKAKTLCEPRYSVEVCRGYHANQADVTASQIIGGLGGK